MAVRSLVRTRRGGKPYLILLWLVWNLNPFMVSGNSIAADVRSSMEEPLLLRIQINKPTFSVGDKIEINYCLRNNSNTDLTVLKWTGAPYPARKLRFVGPNGNNLKDVATAFYELTQFLPRENHVPLKAGAEYCMSFVGVVDREVVKVENSSHSGQLTLKFNNSYLLLDGYGKYQIIGFYRVSEFVSNEGKKLYNISDIWVGKISSEPEQFVLLEQKT